MKVEIKVISTEIIHPSSPTPKDVSKYKISYLDQLNPPFLMPHTIFYKATEESSKLNNYSEISSHLKKTLSKTLSLYYPLAGRIVENSHVDCNDEGITYVEAEANCKLSDVINKANQQVLVKLVYGNLEGVDKDHFLIIQTTFFSCGGLSIGFAFSHKIGDGLSFSLFVNSWAEISRAAIAAGVDDDDGALSNSPIFDGATIFPPRSDMDGSDLICWKKRDDDIVTKRFIFTATKINELRDICSNTTILTQRATRIEALTAFIWTRFMVSTKTNDDADTKRKFNLFLALNIRNRANPPMSSDLFGNFSQHAVPLLDGGEQGTYNGIVEKLREAIRGIDGDYVTKLREGNQTLKTLKDHMKKVLSGEMSPFLFTTMCRCPAFEADFGWGKPVWNDIGAGNHKNVVFFIDSFEGGIEAWITLKLEDMAMFEADEEILAYAATPLPNHSLP